MHDEIEEQFEDNECGSKIKLYPRRNYRDIISNGTIILSLLAFDMILIISAFLNDWNSCDKVYSVLLMVILATTILWLIITSIRIAAISDGNARFIEHMENTESAIILLNTCVGVSTSLSYIYGSCEGSMEKIGIIVILGTIAQLIQYVRKLAERFD